MIVSKEDFGKIIYYKYVVNEREYVFIFWDGVFHNILEKSGGKYYPAFNTISFLLDFDIDRNEIVADAITVMVNKYNIEQALGNQDVGAQEAETKRRKL